MKNTVFKFVVLVGFLFLTSCASHAPSQSKWPSDMPARSLFVDFYNADVGNQDGQDLDEYLLWVFRFYKGWELYRNGWTQVTADAVVGVKDPAVVAEITTKLNAMGFNIASEWAKNKKDRRVLTRHVVIWGNALIESMKRDEEMPLIDKVTRDLDGVLTKKIHLDEITADRYFPKDKDDVFR